MNNSSLNQTQQAVILGFFSPIIEAIVDRVSVIMQESTGKETAAILHITLPTLSRLTNSGLLQAKKIGSRILYDAESIDCAVEQKTVFKYKRSGGHRK